MENVSRGVLDEIKNTIYVVKIKPKNHMLNQDIYNLIQGCLNVSGPGTIEWSNDCSGVGKVLLMGLSMAWCKRDEAPLLTHWSYVSFALSHRRVRSASIKQQQDTTKRETSDISQYKHYGFAQHCSISIANALEILQCCTKPSNCAEHFRSRMSRPSADR